jgi:hypothetical protein
MRDSWPEGQRALPIGPAAFCPAQGVAPVGGRCRRDAPDDLRHRKASARCRKGDAPPLEQQSA